MIYVSDDSNPRPVAPFLVRYLPNKARFLAVTRGQFLSDQYVIQPGEDYTFFFLPNLAGTVVPFLERAFHEDGITPETYTDNRGRVVLLSWSFDHRVLRQGE